MKYLFKNKIKAFTLAEVLLTMTVVGVIAALTIPSLLKNQDKVLRTEFKKIYSDLQQATLMIKSDNNGSMVGAFLLDNDDFRDKYLTYLKYTKKCNYAARNQSACSYGASARKYLNGTSFTDNSGFSYAWLNNGALIEFQLSSVECNSNPGYGGEFASLIICGSMYVDVNGFKGPNTLGKDVYRIWVVRTKNGLIPQGVAGDPSSVQCEPDSYGYGCAYKALYNIDY